MSQITNNPPLCMSSIIGKLKQGINKLTIGTGLLVEAKEVAEAINGGYQFQQAHAFIVLIVDESYKYPEWSLNEEYSDGSWSSTNK